jgi:ribosomal protein S18 acetylase RimI-like enzyme
MTAIETVHIRRAAVDDLATVQAIGRDTYLEHFAHYWSPAGLDAFLLRDFSDDALRLSLASPRHAWFLMEADDAGAVGFAKLNWASVEPVSDETGAELQKIYFRANAVGRGFGGILLEHVLRAATANGEPSLWLNVLKTNTSALRFYRAHGFDTIGERPFRSDMGEDIGMWVLSRRLA